MTTSPSSSTKPLVLDVRVPSQDLSYQVRVGSGLLARLGTEATRGREPGRAALISDTNVIKLYGTVARQSLEAAGLSVITRAVEPGEASKRPEVLLELVGELVAAGLGRRDVVVALGGGVVGDLAGLVAALFMRGIDFIQCPTSLLAQVDASVGGKVAVDLPGGKNLLGAFHFPRAVLIDTDVLQTLPDRELGCGLAEMLKHGALFSVEHFEQLCEHTEALYARDPVLLPRLVAISVALKAACVSRDPLELAGGGKGRVVLNLGHTVGHAIEAASGLALRHGEAVGLGLRAAARLSVAKGLCEPGLEERVVAALTALRLPTELDPWLHGEQGEAVQRVLCNDKKRAGATVTFIGLAGLGEPRTLPLPPAEILPLLRDASPR
ncbi:3-dehydroquinate synthase [Paraliomyxa miuraensis]|uniref:3-dehydroquinate synthase n=1 Tax=Paraliomyxa miuraensis TaxID=376150 RepID=UPI00224D2B74|nr:3-dehydroquinate synthase [Paraliomyxa miuraensis]MCX4240283.1 3-dehydroquinate synthase [Paraliomyxa miuraensis]